jgi:hypothetical protein
MFFSLAVTLAAPAPVTPKIVAASLFKNGYAVVTREIDVPAGGIAMVTDLPSGALGTVWLTTTDGLKLASVKNVEVKSQVRAKVDSVVAFLKLNEGKDVILTVSSGDKIVQGTLEQATDQVILVRTGPTVSAIPTGMVLGAQVAAGAKIETVGTTVSRGLELRVEGGKAGRVYLIGLERGLTWSPSYSLDISDPKTVKFVAKAEILNDVGALNDIEVRLVTGFPNMYFSGVPDPLLARTSVDQYIASLGISDAQANARAEGFGGRAMMTQNAMVQAPMGSVGDSMPIDNLGGLVEGDLFFYRQSHVKLAAGEREYSILAAAELPYKEVYTWDSADAFSVGRMNEYQGTNGQPPPPDDVWHSLEFKDTVGQPLTTGPATTWKDGELLGQDLMSYVSKGSKAVVKITKALDVHVESADEETDRKAQALNVPGSGRFDLVTLKTTLKATNTKAETIHLRITRNYSGELISAEGAVVAKNLKGLRSINPTGKLTWERDLAPGKTLTVQFSAHLYVRNGPGGF